MKFPKIILPERIIVSQAMLGDYFGTVLFALLMLASCYGY